MVEPGLEASVEAEVAPSMTARALGSGDVDVLGTPAVLALAERAACAAIDGRLEPGQTSVGTHVELSHIAPTREGGSVVARARLAAVDGRTLTFEIEVRDRGGVAARGTHRRAVVQRESFLDSAVRRAESPAGDAS